MSAPANPGRNWARGSRVTAGLPLLVAVALATAVLGAATADAVPSRFHTVAVAGKSAYRQVAAAPAATCNPAASSIRPSGPPQVTANSYLATIKRRGYLIAGVDQSTYHFGFLNPLDNQIEGFDIDMIDAVARAIFGGQTKVQFKAISDNDRIPDVQNGSVDIVAHTMTITCDRLRLVDFSTVYFDAAQRVLVRKDSTARSLADLRGQKVCATNGSDSLLKIKAAGVIPVAVQYWTDCLVQLQQDDVAAISTDDSILDGLAAQDPFTKLIGPPLTSEPYGLAISKKHPDFVAFVNAVLEQLRTNSQWKASYSHWIGTPVPNPPPAQYGS